MFAGNHAITAAYSGDANYAKTTSPAATLTIQPDTAGFSAYFISPTTLAPVSSLSVGTAQGSTALANVTVVPTNTLNGTVTFACSGLPANSVCTVTPTSLIFTPVPGVAAAQTVGVTLWTDVAPGVVPTTETSSQAIRPANMFGPIRTLRLPASLGWPVFLSSLAGVLGFRKRLRKARLLAIAVACGLLTGGSMVLERMQQRHHTESASLTPTGSYNVNLTVSGPNNTSQTMPHAVHRCAGCCRSGIKFSAISTCRGAASRAASFPWALQDAGEDWTSLLSARHLELRQIDRTHVSVEGIANDEAQAGYVVGSSRGSAKLAPALLFPRGKVSSRMTWPSNLFLLSYQPAAIVASVC